MSDLVERLLAWKRQYRGDGEEETIPLAAKAAARITALETALAEAKTWRDAVDNALVTDWLGTADSFPDAATAVARLIEWSMTVAVDPAVSKPAADLVAEAEGRVIADVVAWLRDGAGYQAGHIGPGTIVHYEKLATALETGEWKK